MTLAKSLNPSDPQFPYFWNQAIHVAFLISQAQIMYIYFKILGSIQDLPTESLEVGLGLFCKSPTAQTHAGL